MQVISISMIRIWNYNKNRIHAYRGARYIQITLDDVVVFRGEVQRAAGTTATEAENCSECILFTTNSTILGLIEKYDPIAQQAIKKKREAEIAAAKSTVSRQIHWDDVASHLDAMQDVKTPRPNRLDGAINGSDPVFSVGDDLAIRPQWSDVISVVRPTTGRSRIEDSQFSGISRRGTSKVESDANIWLASTASSYEDDDQCDLLAHSIDLGNLALNRNYSFGDRLLRPQSTHTNLRERPSTAAMARTMPPAIVHKSIEIFLLSSWGDPQYIGFSGVCGIDKDLEEFSLPIPETAYYVYSLDGAAPLYKHTPMNGTDNGMLVSGSRMTSSYEDMWVGQHHKGLVIGMKFDIDHSTSIKGLRIWNFNAGKEDSSMGVKHMEISIDGGRRKAVIVRKAPGNCTFDYSQFLPVGVDIRAAAVNYKSSSRIYSKSNSFGDYDSPSRHHHSLETDLKSSKETKDFLSSDLPSAQIVDDDDYSSVDSDFAKNKKDPSFVVENSVCLVPQLYETPVWPLAYYCLDIK